jgi:O-antigen/teichoic acid export membrane protein
MILLERVFKNSISSVIKNLISTVILFLLTPFVLYKVGMNDFGIWSLLSIISNPSSIVDLGLNAGLVFFIAKEKGKSDFKYINIIFNSVFSLFLIISLIVILVLWILRTKIYIHIFHLSSKDVSKIDLIFIFSLFTFLINFIANSFRSLLIGFQRMDISNYISLVIQIFWGIGIVIFLNLDFGLLGLACNSFIIGLINLFVLLFFCYKVFPYFRINVLFFDFQELKKMFVYSSLVQLQVWLGFLYWNIIKVLISYFLNPTFVSYYEISNRIVGQLVGFLRVLVSPLMPAVAEIFSMTGKEKVKIIYQHIFKYSFLYGIFSMVGIFLFIDNFIYLWLGKRYIEINTSAYFMMISYFFNLLTFGGCEILYGMGKPLVVILSSFISLLFLIVSFVGLIPWLGYIGVLLSLFVSMASASIYLLVKVNKILGLGKSFFAYLREYKISIFLFSLVYVILKFYFIAIGSNTIIYFSIGIFIYLILSFGIFVSSLDKFDKDILLKGLRNEGKSVD